MGLVCKMVETDALIDLANQPLDEANLVYKKAVSSDLIRL